MSIALLTTELASGHPDTGAYDGNAETAADELNAINRTTNKTSMTSSEVYNAIDPTEYTALSTTDKEEVWNIIHLGELNPFGLEATRMTALFGGGSTTITALAALRKNNVSRAVEIGFGFVKPGNVLEARL